MRMVLIQGGDKLTTIPTRESVILILEGLCSKKMNRAEVASWAVSIIENDSIRINDDVVWDVLKKLGAVDLPAPDRDFLYMDLDFKGWISEL